MWVRALPFLTFPHSIGAQYWRYKQGSNASQYPEDTRFSLSHDTCEFKSGIALLSCPSFTAAHSTPASWQIRVLESAVIGVIILSSLQPCSESLQICTLPKKSWWNLFFGFIIINFFLQPLGQNCHRHSKLPLFFYDWLWMPVGWVSLRSTGGICLSALGSGG